MATEAFVVIYKKVDPRDAAHWALWLTQPTTKSNWILQIEDDEQDRGYFVTKPQAERPDASDSLHETIKCATISAEHSLSSLVDIVQGLSVNNDSTTWNCQNWVVDALEALKSKGLDIPLNVMNNLRSKRENPEYTNYQAGKLANVPRQ